jgi:glutamate/tyrosine decarboxylase-like PLP-dependent enzyme
MASEISREPAIEILNDVVLNQVLVRVARSDAVTDETVRAVQSDGTCWVGGTRWHDRSAIRISISSWATTADDVVRSAAAIRTAATAATERRRGRN